jgi:hypothetical protein
MVSKECITLLIIRLGEALKLGNVWFDAEIPYQ